MNPTVIGAAVFLCTFGGALLGLWLRVLLPKDHMTDDTKDTVKLGVGLVATMTALVLGLVTASAKNSFDEVDTAVKHTAIDILTLDRVLARYGPETKEIRAAMKQSLGRKIEQIWPQERGLLPQLDPAESATSMEVLLDGVRKLTPRDDEQRRLQAKAGDLSETLLATRWLAVADSSTSIPFAFLVILVLWLTTIFASFGLFAPRNATVLAVLFLCSVSVGSAVFLVLELDRPLDGLIKVSPDPLRNAYERMNR
jgi:Protein of unknown function (DUF4239)